MTDEPDADDVLAGDGITDPEVFGSVPEAIALPGTAGQSLVIDLEPAGSAPGADPRNGSHNGASPTQERVPIQAFGAPVASEGFWTSSKDTTNVLLWGPRASGKTNLLWAISQTVGVSTADNDSPAGAVAARICVEAREASTGHSNLSKTTVEIEESAWQWLQRRVNIADVPGELCSAVRDYVLHKTTSVQVSELIVAAQGATALAILFDPTGDRGEDEPADSPHDYTAALLQLLQSEARKLVEQGRVAVVMTKLDEPDVLVRARNHLTWQPGLNEAPYLTSEAARAFFHDVLAQEDGATGDAAYGIAKDLAHFADVQFFAVSALGFRRTPTSTPRANPFRQPNNAKGGFGQRRVLRRIEGSTQRLGPLLEWSARTGSGGPE